MQDTEAVRAYAGAVRDLLAHGGYERTGNVAEARRWGREHPRFRVFEVRPLCLGRLAAWR